VLTVPLVSKPEEAGAVTDATRSETEEGSILMHEDEKATPRPYTGPSRASGDPMLLRTGTYLHAYCPLCGADLVENRLINFEVTTKSGEVGVLKLSPRFNVFDKDSDVAIEHGSEVEDLRCPRCHTSLLSPDTNCGFCGARTVRLRISAIHLDFDLYLCARIGCRWHGVSDEDRRRLILERSKD
jgi:hypothetical protein